MPWQEAPVKLYPPPGGWPNREKEKAEQAEKQAAKQRVENLRVARIRYRQANIAHFWGIVRLFIALIILVMCVVHFGAMGFVFFAAAFVVLFGMLPRFY